MKKLYLAVFTSVLLAGSALADPATVEPASEPQPRFGALYTTSAAGLVTSRYRQTTEGATNSWNGLYTGINLSGWVKSTGYTIGLFQGVVGYNVVTSNSLLFGAEITAGGWAGSGSSGWAAGLEARFGTLVDPNVLIYGSAGVESLDGTSKFGKIGAGLEFALDDTFSIDLEYDYLKRLNGGGLSANSFGASFIVNF